MLADHVWSLLEDLISAGLFALYPEFADHQSMNKWTSRTELIREAWSRLHCTKQDEIKIALNIDERCFHEFPGRNMALVLLGFKQRELAAPWIEGMLRAIDLVLPADEFSIGEFESFQDGPVEVRRYQEAIATLAARDGHPGWIVEPDVFEVTHIDGLFKMHG